MQANEERSSTITTPALETTPAGNNGDVNGHVPVAARHKGGGHGGDEHQIPVDLPEITRGGAVMIAVALLVLFGALFLVGWLPLSRRQAEARHNAEQQLETKPVVDVVTPKKHDATVDLLLPAQVQPFQETAISARTGGYLKPLPPGIDIGAKVKAGQLLAEISAPEVDAELEQAKAAVEQAQVNVGRSTNEFNLRSATYERYTGLAKTGGVTQQQIDEKRADYNIANSNLKAAKASVAVAEANVKRLTEMQGFQRIVAPFDGKISARNVDAGALISASGANPGRELFRVIDSDKLRVFVNVPQTYATEVRQDQTADLLVRNYPGKAFTGQVARTTGEIDPATRTLKVEVDIPNSGGQLLPNMWGQVRFKIHQQKPPVVLPTSALVFSPDGMKVATVVEGNRIAFKHVTVGRDFGTEAEITEGLADADRVVTNPGERLADGVEVKVIAPKDAKPTAQASAR
jgi:RND family efflux transporter MFP subunit